MTTQTKFGGQRGGTMLAPQFKEWAKSNGGEDLLGRLLELRKRYDTERKNTYLQYKPEALRKSYEQAQTRMAKMKAAAEFRGITL